MSDYSQPTGNLARVLSERIQINQDDDAVVLTEVGQKRRVLRTFMCVQ